MNKEDQDRRRRALLIEERRRLEELNQQRDAAEKRRTETANLLTLNKEARGISPQKDDPRWKRCASPSCGTLLGIQHGDDLVYEAGTGKGRVEIHIRSGYILCPKCGRRHNHRLTADSP